MPKIFISYRHTDSEQITSRIYDRLVDAFGEQNVFMDNDSIPLGTDFPKVLRDKATNCDVMLVIIGPQWLTITDESGQRRLEDPNDFVRLEVKLGLEGTAWVIPVMVDNASPVGNMELPADLEQLAYKQATPIYNSFFDEGVQRIIKGIQKFEERSLNWILLAAIVFLVIVALVGILLLVRDDDENGISEIANETSTVPSSETFTITKTETSVPTLTSSLTNSVTTSAAHNSPPILTDTAMSTPTIPDRATLAVTLSQTSPPITAFVPTTTTQTLESTDSTNDDVFKVTIETFSNHDFAFVPAGSFTSLRGSANDSFWIGVYEVTNAQFATFLNARSGNLSNELEPLFDEKGTASRIDFSGGAWRVQAGYEDHPVVYVSWFGARDYCESIGGHLPSAAEWEKAATWQPTTGENTTYPWGDNPPTTELANFDRTIGGTVPINEYSDGQSALGVFNMSGNVAEWVADTQGTNRYYFGGGWDSPASDIIPSNNHDAVMSYLASSVGFRCAR